MKGWGQCHHQERYLNDKTNEINVCHLESMVWGMKQPFYEQLNRIQAMIRHLFVTCGDTEGFDYGWENIILKTEDLGHKCGSTIVS